MARETVGELIERLGEREAYTHILVYNIKLRLAAQELLSHHDATCADTGVCPEAQAVREAIDGA